MTADLSAPREVLRISEVNRRIAAVVAAGLRGEVWVVGEVSKLRETNGSRYFDLVEHDAGSSRTLAQLPAVVLRWERAGFDAELARIDGFTLTNGVEILVRGRIEFYEPWGKVQLKVLGIDPAYTLGRMQAARDQLLADLVRRGVLRRNAARPVGQPPLHVGLVTAPGSDAEHDLRARLAASGWGFEVVRAGARVQGPACEAEVAAAIGRLAVLHRRRPLDVVVVIRGGGSAVDLQGFDTPGVAAAIVDAPFPVWTGIGHEKNRSVADEVAHTAWPTPTAVGHGLVAAVDACDARVREASHRLVAGVESVRQRVERQLARRTAELDRATARRLRGAHVGLQRSTAELGRLAEARLRREHHELVRRRGVLTAAAARATVPAQRQRLEVIEARLHAADPARQLARGFTITTDEAGRVLRSTAQAASGQQLRTRLIDGVVTSRVEQVDLTTSTSPADPSGTPTPTAPQGARP